ncbi:MAG TPA: FKBP-type peptidyl-prolyl cis-trans isomerase [Nitrospira sp.]|nr:FKBP-type peptidyl-prolyl cis-trans isomerase [Nitrospira sp.]
MSVSRMTELPAHDLAVRRVRVGDTIRVNFLAWSEEGTLVDSSLFGEPLVFTAGQGTVMPGMEHLVIGMAVGESRTEELATELAFGPYRTELTCRVSAGWFEEQKVSPAIGLSLDIRATDGTRIRMVITDMDGDQITLDANHCLAGRNLILQVDLLDFVEAPDVGVRRHPVATS